MTKKQIIEEIKILLQNEEEEADSFFETYRNTDDKDTCKDIMYNAFIKHLHSVVILRKLLEKICSDEKGC